MNSAARMKLEEKRAVITMDSSDLFAHPARSAAEKAKAAACDFDNCSGRSMVAIESRRLCLEHVVSYCYFRLQECEQGEGFETMASPTGAARSTWEILEEYRSKMASVLIVRTDLSNLERARLLDILLWATELFEKEKRRWPLRWKVQAE
jgi:hypothetical protein